MPYISNVNSQPREIGVECEEADLHMRLDVITVMLKVETRLM